jgi:TRAP-type C4-dicarboxylate transport system substrate-binding protein
VLDARDKTVQAGVIQSMQMSPGTTSAMTKPIQIRMGGYGPSGTGFSRALKFIGDRLASEFGNRVEIKYVWNIMDLGYRAEDILWLVEHGLLTLGYQSSSYLTERVPELGIVDLPFLFASTQAARAAMDGELGAVLARKIEERVNFGFSAGSRMASGIFPTG